MTGSYVESSSSGSLDLICQDVAAFLELAAFPFPVDADEDLAAV